MQSTDEWPSFAEELGRKSLEVLEKWTKKFEAGEISRREVFILVDGLYDTTSGLIPRDVSDLIANVHKEIKTGKPT